MKIFLILVTLLTSFNASSKIDIVTPGSHISTYSFTFETVSDALDYRDHIYFTTNSYFTEAKILGANIYEVTLSTDNYKIKECKLIEGKY